MPAYSASHHKNWPYVQIQTSTIQTAQVFRLCTVSAPNHASITSPRARVRMRARQLVVVVLVDLASPQLLGLGGLPGERTPRTGGAARPVTKPLY